MSHQERDEDICFNNPQSDLNTLPSVGSSGTYYLVVVVQAG